LLTREPLGLLWESHIAHSEREDLAFGAWVNEGSESILSPDRELAVSQKKHIRTKHQATGSNASGLNASGGD
jgi:hypothetical protein